VFHLGLDPFPVYPDVLGIFDRCVAENVRMTADHLRGDLLQNVPQVEFVRLLGQTREKEDVEEEVAEFLPEVLR